MGDLGFSTVPSSRLQSFSRDLDFGKGARATRRRTRSKSRQSRLRRRLGKRCSVSWSRSRGLWDGKPGRKPRREYYLTERARISAVSPGAKIDARGRTSLGSDRAAPLFFNAAGGVLGIAQRVDAKPTAPQSEWDLRQACPSKEHWRIRSSRLLFHLPGFLRLLRGAPSGARSVCNKTPIRVSAALPAGSPASAQARRAC